MTLIDHAAGCAIGDGVSVCTCGAIGRLGAAPAVSTHATAFIHPLAHVEGSRIGPGCRIWQFASVTRGTVLGEGCSVAPFAVLDGPRFGARCIISMHVAMGPGFIIGDECFIGPSVTFCNDAFPRADKTGWDAEALRDGRCVTIRVGDRVGVGAHAVILPGVTLGDDSFVAAGAVCDRDVPRGHLFKRSGEIVEINTAWAKRRMKAARPVNSEEPPHFGMIVSGEAA
jgi:UDP-2-acetamido-3-amino-2,3-dideoxy-glucuronate N-acetyltransferase